MNIIYMSRLRITRADMYYTHLICSFLNVEDADTVEAQQRWGRERGKQKSSSY